MFLYMNIHADECSSKHPLRGSGRALGCVSVKKSRRYFVCLCLTLHLFTSQWPPIYQPYLSFSISVSQCVLLSTALSICLSVMNDRPPTRTSVRT